jgi:acyl-CoA hydrolase
MRPVRPAATGPEQLLRHVAPGTQVVVPVANGEPRAFVDALERAPAGGDLDGVELHQLLPFRERPHHAGAFPGRLRHVSYFLSASLRPQFEAGHVGLVPNDFHALPDLMRRRLDRPLCPGSSRCWPPVRW